MISKEELQQLIKMTHKCSKYQLMSIIQYIEQISLKNQMSDEEYIEYFNTCMASINRHKFFLMNNTSRKRR